MVKITYQEMVGSVVGFSKANTDQVFIDKSLQQFPRLKNVVLKHEIGHIQDKNLLQALLRDFKDYPKILFHDDYPKWVKTKNTEKPCVATFIVNSFGVPAYTILAMSYSALVIIAATTYHAIRTLQR